MHFNLDAFLSGFGLSLSLILAIGAQNAFVLRQGLRQEHVFWVCLICAVSDATLILSGIIGFSLAEQQFPGLAQLMRYAGSLFLICYGARSFWTAWRNPGTLLPSRAETRPLFPTLIICLAITWLNPHVYLDTVFLIGSIATQFPGQHTAFATGAILASILFFFSLGYGAQLLRPVFATQSAWRNLEIFVGIIMWGLAIHLLFSAP
jgi:L-lysine exporter family protein LysE/ArgO